METGVNVEELIGDGERVVGVRANAGRQGHVRQGQQGRGDRGQRATSATRISNKTLGSMLDPESMVFSTIDGANFRLAGPFGARIARVPEITLAGLPRPRRGDDEGMPLWRSAMPIIGLPHTIVVNRKGKRFGNEAFYRSFYYKIDIIDGGTQTHPNFPCWVVIDSQAREKYAVRLDHARAGLARRLRRQSRTRSASWPRRPASMPQGLEETVARFNANAEKGEDPDFGRGTHAVGRLDDAAIHTTSPTPTSARWSRRRSMRSRCTRMGGTGIPAAGLLTDHHCRVVGWDDKPIPGLYVAGNSVARMETGAVMQSGVSNARGMTHGWLAGRHAAGSPSDLLQKEIERLGR